MATKSKKTSAAAAAKANETVLKRARTVGWLSILEALAVGVLGGFLIAKPDWILQVIFYTLGVFLMVKGVYKIVNYFVIHGKYDFYNNDLLYGVIALIFGVLSVILWEQLSGAIGLVVGAWVIYGALVRLNAAIKLHAVNVKSWFYVLLLSLVMLALGIYMIIGVGVVAAVVGWIMIAAAVVSIVDDFFFIRNVDAITK